MKMRFKKQILLALVAPLFMACAAGNGNKPLIGGIQGGGAAKESAALTEESAALTEESAAAVPDGLEIPAPLNGSNEQILRREGYTVSYNSDTKLPNWVAWELDASRLSGTAKRKGVDFAEDDDVPEPRATKWDYYSSGYDRGHMCPAGDNKWSEKAMVESFLFTNVCPQAPNLNRGDWNEMENACRKWAKEYGKIYIVCGPILYKGKHKTIGDNRVVVPEAFFKVVLRMGYAPEAIGFIYKNADGNRPKGDYVNTVDEVERITGIDFFPSLPDDVEKNIEATAHSERWGI